jgi:AmmeMemoRadiSam system protein A
MITLSLTAEERRALLQLARNAILAHLTRGPAPTIGTGAAASRLGAFVSIHVRGELRGCIGCPQPDRTLGETVARCAVSAASEDPRFPPLMLSELPDAQIEISVLGPIEPVKDPASEIVVGRHGLIVSRGYCKGLLLPQVATEHDWDRETFLSHTCLKAGLRPDAWRTGARISRFEAEVFAEQAEKV